MPTYSHLLDEERDQIAVMKAAGRSICAIARALQRAKSTVSRELRRNALSSGRYSPLHAAGAYQLRSRREAILEKDQKLRTFVCDRLAEGWTPEQIAERGLRALGFEAIYAFIYSAARKGEDLWRYLTRRFLTAVAEDKSAHAEQAATRAEKDRKEAAIAYRNLGAIAGLRDPKSALEAYEKAASLDPGDVESLFWAGWIEIDHGDLNKAQTRLERVLKLAETGDQAYY